MIKSVYLLVIICLASGLAEKPKKTEIFHYREQVKTQHVRLGDNLTITADLPFTYPLKNYSAAHYYWTKERSHPAASTLLKGFSIGQAGNCSIQQAYYGRRIQNCGKNLTITNITKWDSGRYTARYKYRTGLSDLEHTDVTVFESFPVLAAVYYNKYYTVVNCVDLKNPHASRRVEQRKRDHHFQAIITAYKNNPGYFKLAVDLIKGYLIKLHVTEDHFYADFRCCADYKNTTTCGPWTLIYHHMYLGTSGNRWRPWCSHRGGHQLAKIWKGGPHMGDLFEPTCDRHVFLPKESVICEGENNQIINFTSPLKMYRELRGLQKLADKPPYWINNTHFYDEGDYFEKDKNQTFHITVKPRLYAALQIIKREQGYIDLNCTHTGSPEAKITWYIEGQYAKLETNGASARVYELCWQDYTYWKADFGLKCHVSDPPFSVSSRWLMVDSVTTDYLRCADRGAQVYVFRCDKRWVSGNPYEISNI